MRNIYFDQDEMTLMAIFSAKTKRETVAVLKEALADLEHGDPDEQDEEMEAILSSLIEKLQQIRDQHFYSLNLQEYLNNIEDDTDDA